MIDNLIWFLGSMGIIFLSGVVLYVLFALMYLPRYFRKP